jgi:hypothetical protein
MSSQTDNQKSAFAALMHDTLDEVTTILSIAQFCLISRELSPEVQTDMKRIVETGKTISNKLKQLAEVYQEER